MNDVIEWLKERDSYNNQIIAHEIEPGQESTTTQDLSLDPRVETALDEHGITSLYQHQADTITAVRNDDNIVIATPTASGKTLTYTIPAFERALTTGGRTLYIAPLNALINNQAQTLSEFANAIPTGDNIDIATYTGQVSDSVKEEIRRERHPDILLMTPDMVHESLLPYSKSKTAWKWLFNSLDTIVIDEVHQFNGVFGSQISLVLRRLNRMAEWAGADPQYICCSATIGNPIEHAATVTGKDPDSYSLINTDASDRGERHWVFWNPPLKKEAKAELDNDDEEPFESPHHNELIGAERRSHHPETSRLFTYLVERGYQTLVFTKTRQGAEQYAKKCDAMLRDRADSDLANKTTAYHGQLPDDRRELIETGLTSGDVRGVWSTDALELGIDIGTLDVVLLDGYPGTTRSLMQCAGRAGRGDDPCLVILVASPNPLDQYHMQDPAALLDADPESATVNPENQEILPGHVWCAAQELWLRVRDKEYFGADYPNIVSTLTETGLLKRDLKDEIRWETPTENPQQSVPIRAIESEQYTLYDRLRNEKLASLQVRSAFRDAHPGAIYYHQKETYRATDIDTDSQTIYVESENTSGYTRPITKKSISPGEEITSKSLDSYDLTVTLTEMEVEEQVEEYMEYSNMNDEDGDKKTIPMDLPKHTLSTKGLYFDVPRSVELEIKQKADVDTAQDARDAYLSALHAVEHALISLFPLYALCKRGDVGGQSLVKQQDPVNAMLDTPASTNRSGTGTVFIHEGHPGGVGLVKEAYENIEEMLDEVRELLQNCPCDSGCPSCVHSPQCGNVNQHLDKHLAIELLDYLATPQEIQPGVRNTPSE